MLIVHADEYYIRTITEVTIVSFT